MSTKLRILALLMGTLLFLPTAGLLHAQEPDSSANKFGFQIGYEGWQLLGHDVSLHITKVSGTGDMHGFDLLIGYDTAALTFNYADAIDLIYEYFGYEWEYVEGYLVNPQNCADGSCPSGLIRITGIADLDNGDHHPLNLSIADGTELCMLDFTITNDSAFDCSFTPVQFFWADCGDNSLAVDLSPGINLAVSDTVYSWNGDNYEVYPAGVSLPGPYGSPDSCLAENPSAARLVEFYDGGVGIVCADSIDRRGDINCNGIAYQIADYEMFLNYFRIGFPAFYNHVEASIVATDVNADGLTLTVADVYYLYGVIIGAFNPFPAMAKIAPDTGTLIFRQALSTRTVSFDYPNPLGAVCCVFDGDITPTLLIDTTSFTCNYYFNRGVTAVVIIPPMPDIGKASLPGIPPGPLFTYAGQGRLRLYDQHYRMTGGATLEGQAIPYPFPAEQIIQVDSEGTAGITPGSMPRSLARISDHESCTIYLSDFAVHSVYDVDQSSLVVNDSIAPLSVSVIPGSPDKLALIVPARDFIRSYAYGDDTLGYYPHPTWPPPSDTSWNYLYSVHGQFTDATAFTSLGSVTIANGTATIPVPSGWSTINEAVAAAFPGDTVMLAEGYFSGDGNRDLDLSGKKILLTSESGAETTSIGCGGSETEYHYFAQCVDSPADSTVQISGLTIRDAYSADRGAIYINNAAPLIKGCRFEYNSSTGSGGAINIVDASPDIEFCLFLNNHAVTGGAIAAGGTGEPYLANCTFVANVAESSGGGLYADGAVPSVTNCLFVFGIGGGAIGLGAGGSPPPLSCTDIFGNDGGDWTGDIADQLGQAGNFSADPQFCNPGDRDYHLNGGSPCLPYLGDCHALTGAYESGCGLLCGDANGDYRINIADVVYLINYIFKSGPPPVYVQACDVNLNGDVEVGDVIMMIDFIFRNGPELSCTWN